MKKPSLAETQHWVRSRILPDHARLSSEIKVGLNPQGSVPGEQRLSVYAEGYEIRFRDGVAEVYETVQWILGEHQFAELVKDYSEKYPSKDYNLSFVGRHLPAFISAAPLSKELPFLADLARLEWSICEAFHAFDKTPLSAEELSKVSPEILTQSKLIFQPSISVLSSDWPIFDIWNSRKKPKEEISVDLRQRPQSVMVYRRGVKVECRILEGWQSVLLESLIQGESLETACENIADDFNGDTETITAWFAGLIQDKQIVQIQSSQL